MDWLRPIRVNTRSGSLSMPRALQALSVIIFLAITLSILNPIGHTPDPSSKTLGARSGCDFPAIFNFGDSNSDTGGKSSAFRRLPYPNGMTFFRRASGRYCDGKLILDFIAEKLGLPYASAYLDPAGTNLRHGANFATGGSTIQAVAAKIHAAGFSPISLDIQLSEFKQLKERAEEIFAQDSSGSGAKSNIPHPGDFSKALYTLDIGQNDLHFGLKSMTEDELKALLPNIIGLLVTTVKELYRLGGRTFWIHNTGPVGCLPYSIIRFPPDPENVDRIGCVKSHNDIAREFNGLLDRRVGELRFELTDAAITYVDVYSAKYTLITEAKKYGFENPLGYCCGHYGDYYVQCGKKAIVNGTEIDGKACKDPSKYISWDGIHYTHSANEWVARQIVDGSRSDPLNPINEACYKTSNSTKRNPKS